MKKLLLSLMSAAVLCTAYAQTDRTELIPNPSFESGFEKWEQSGMQTQTNNDFPKKAGNVYVEKWVSQSSTVGNASVKQTLTGLPMGRYKLVAGAMNYSQADTEKQCEGAYIFAGDVKATVYTPNDYELEFTTVSGEVEIGFQAVNAKGNWLACDNFRLYLIGDVDFADAKAELDRLIAKGEGISGKIQSGVAADLAAAISAAKAITASSSMADVQTAVDNLTAAINAANESKAEYTALDAAIADAAALEGKKMNADVAANFASALAAAKAITLDSQRSATVKATTDLVAATADAKVSVTDYEALAKALADAKKAVSDNPAMASSVQPVIDQAQAMYDNGSGDTEAVYAIIDQLATAQLEFNLAHATGPVPTVKTHPYVARGSRLAFGRLEADKNGAGKIIEKGFCWAENPAPTVLDARSSEFYSHKGEIYVMRDLQPAKRYYVRAYAISDGYQVGYGDVIKVVTLPAANSTWSWERNDATDEEDARCQFACSEAINNYNLCSGIRGFHLSAHYVKGAGAGSGTADCSYGGWMRISQNVPYQRCGTVQHETNHGVGIGTSDRWWNSNLRADGDRGLWLGRRANELINFFENVEPGLISVTGDRTHMWATTINDSGVTGMLNYGINGAHEDSGSQLLYYANAMLTEYLCEDGINPTWDYHNGMPCYTFDFEEGAKYYLVNESEECGLLDGGMISDRGTATVRWYKNTSVTDADAWTLEYNYEEGLYRFKNVATGNYLTHDEKRLGFAAGEPGYNQEFQLMPSRYDVRVGNEKTFGYWLTWYSETNKDTYVIRANEYGNGFGSYIAARLNFADKSTNMRYFIVSEDKIDAFLAAAAGVQSVDADAEKTVIAIYSIDGKLLDDLRPGVNIVRYSDGTARKVVK